MSNFIWLLKREYWEHRGGFMRAPAITALVFLAFTVMALITAEVTMRRMSFDFNNLHMQELLSNIGSNDIAKVKTAVDVALLGALYDDRRDRSILFWNSLPLSDMQTVLSKVVTAALVAPAFAVAAMIALHLGFLVLLSIYALLHGINPFPLLWSPLHLIALWLKLILVIPLNALWALPCIGWFLLCSSFVRSKPFLWAFALPVLSGILIWWVNLMSQLSLPRYWFWQHVVARALFSIFPGSWMNDTTIRTLVHSHDGEIDLLGSMLSMESLKAFFASSDLWIGAIAGAAMITAAIYYRGRRTEAYA